MKKNLAKAWLLLCSAFFWLNAWAIDVAGWTCSGIMDQNCGVGNANGVVSNAPVSGSTGYAWISTVNAPDFPVTSLPPGIGNTSEVTNGATFRSAPFSASANTDMSFYFNYVTSDGSTNFTDFAWARLLDGTGNQVALLFTARTHPTQSVVPGVNLPAPQATLNPTNIPIIAGGPSWDKLDSSSGQCYQSGCGYSGWVHATYKIATAGSYQLEIGVVNWGDTNYASGLAVDGLLVAGSVPSNLTLNQPPSGVPVGTAPTYSGTVANPGGITTVNLRVTGPSGYSEDLQATILPNGSYSALGAALPAAGTYTVVATLAGTNITQTKTFNVVSATGPAALMLNQPANIFLGNPQNYNGSVSNWGSATTVQLHITGPGGYNETLNASIQPNGTYSALGAVLPTIGSYTVTASLTGTTLTQTRSFQVLASAPLPSNARAVPLMGSWGLAWVVGLLSATGAYLLRRKK